MTRTICENVLTIRDKTNATPIIKMLKPAIFIPDLVPPDLRYYLTGTEEATKLLLLVTKERSPLYAPSYTL